MSWISHWNGTRQFGRTIRGNITPPSLESQYLTLYSVILRDCGALQASLPPRYHLSGHLKDFQGSAIERDFVASAALNLLHVRFLLHSSFIQGSPNDELISVSAAMLKLAAEVAVLKSTLANSGTGFIWKASSYRRPSLQVADLSRSSSTDYQPLVSPVLLLSAEVHRTYKLHSQSHKQSKT